MIIIRWDKAIHFNLVQDALKMQYPVNEMKDLFIMKISDDTEIDKQQDFHVNILLKYKQQYVITRR